MVVKQAIPPCVCGQAIILPEGQVLAKCPYGAVWELGREGRWSVKSITLIYVVPLNFKRDEYPRYPRRGKRRRRR